MAKFELTKMPPRVLIMGESASGKTGALAQLANAGYRLLIHDFDQNARVIGNYLKEGHADVYIKTYDVARLVNVGSTAEAEKVQKAAVVQMNEFFRMLKHWKTETEDLGPSASLTARDVVIIDSVTFLGELCFMAAHQHPDANRHAPTIYRIAGQFVASIMDYFCGKQMGASSIALTHIQLFGKKDEKGDFIGKTREIPTAIGKEAAKRLPQYFSDIWRLDVGRTGERTFNTQATDSTSLRASSPTIKATEPFDLANIFGRLTAA